MCRFRFAFVATAAVFGFSSAAFAADLPVKAYPVAPIAAHSWTGCYIGAGVGGAITKNDHHDLDTALGTALSPNLSTGAEGWFGTVGAGCDYQFNNFVVGVFGDYDLMSIKGDVSTGGFFAPALTGQQKQDYQWAVGGRVGYLVMPSLLTYVSGGYTQAHWKSTDLFSFFAGGIPVANLSGSTRGGWFLGTGDEYALSFMPGLFWKTEYRYSQFGRGDALINSLPSGLPTGVSSSQQFHEHSVRSELVYRFN